MSLDLSPQSGEPTLRAGVNTFFRMTLRSYRNRSSENSIHTGSSVCVTVSADNSSTFWLPLQFAVSLAGRDNLSSGSP